MNRRRKSPSKDQLALPLDRNKRLEVLRDISPERLNVGRRQWARVVDLITQVEVCCRRDGCFAYVETLAARMDGKVGVSKATLMRAKRVAEEHGLLVIEKRHDGHRQQSNEWKVAWDRIAILARSTTSTSPEEDVNPGSPDDKIDQSVSSVDQSVSLDSVPLAGGFSESQTDTPGVQTDTPGVQTDTPGVQTDTLYIRNSSSSIPTSDWSTKGRPNQNVSSRKPRAPASIPPPSDPDRVGREIRRFYHRKKISYADAELVWKALAISEHLLGENWLQDAIDGIIFSRPKNKFGYLHTTLSNSAAEAGYSLRQLLARTRKPPGSWHPFRPSVDLSQRLCAAGGLDDEC